MKAVILENRDGYSAVLREDGVIEKLKMQGEVGDTIIVEPNRRKQTAQFYRYAQVAAAAAVFLVAAGSARHYVFATSSYVTMDVNPSVEFAMNRMERVIDVAAVNEDAEEIVSSLKEGRIWGRTLADVIGETTQILEEYEYLSGSDDTVLFAVATDSDEEYAKIEASVLEAEGSANGLTVEVIRGGREDHDRAGELSLSVGRYLKMMEGISENNDANATPDSSSKPGPDDETVKEYRQMSVEDMLGKGNPEGPQDTQSAQMDGQSGKPAEAGADGNAGQEPGNGVSGGTAGNAGGGQAGAGAKDGGAQSGVGASDGGAQSGAQNGAGQSGAQPEAQSGAQSGVGASDGGAQSGAQNGAGQSGAQPEAQSGAQSGVGASDGGAQSGAQNGAGQSGAQPEAQSGAQSGVGASDGGAQSGAQNGAGQSGAQPEAQSGAQSGVGASDGGAQSGAQNEAGQMGAQPEAPVGAGTADAGQMGGQSETQFEAGSQGRMDT